MASHVFQDWSFCFLSQSNHPPPLVSTDDDLFIVPHTSQASAMVFFSCEGCNETLKKAQVEKHIRRCNCPVSCVDCSKVFPGLTYHQVGSKMMLEDIKHTSITSLQYLSEGRAVIHLISVVLSFPFMIYHHHSGSIPHVFQKPKNMRRHYIRALR